MKNPKVTVLCVVHNGERFLWDSAQSILKQTYQDFEFLLIDDGSTDGTPDLIDKIAATDDRVRTFRHDQMGLTKSLNQALPLARGQYIARQDDDDLSHHQRLDQQISYLESHPECAVMGCHYEWIDEKDRVFDRTTVPKSSMSIKLSLLFKNVIPHPGATFRISQISDLGGYDESLRYAQDYDLWCRVALKYDLANLPQFALKRRDHQGRIGVSKAKEQKKARDLIRWRYRKALLKKKLSLDGRFSS